MAEEISGRIKSELGLTVSIGLSWTKVFAKLGSDGLCYTIRIGERVAQLFYEDPRWFVQEALSDELAC